ncbi:MAG: NAD-dependent DNA ligase LigA [Candidatus Pacebacteria bacterium]|nr:NAD-dependent DNA ligase LigA [Candidatus Paceibacterota bacterium]MBP9840224.1 NAD-dependent DNA ligase LigA [Candidatus Paceibacterota bacterium]
MQPPEEARARAAKLRLAIRKYRALQHEKDETALPEGALDSLKHELSSLEEAYPELVTADSPTQKVAGAVLPELKKVRHKVAQWSLNDAFDESDVQAFAERVERGLDRAGVSTRPEYSCELKIDGLHIVLTYEKGKLTQAATRGDGTMGEDVTHTVRMIKSVPERLTRAVDLVVEGEIYMSRAGFQKLNAARRRAGEPEFANARNVAAGSVRQLDPRVTAERPLGAYLYDINLLAGADMPVTQTKELALIKELGLPVNRHSVHADTIDEVLAFWKEWGDEKKRDEEDYLIDGVVVKLESRRQQELLGYTGKAPRFALAIKFAAEQVTTVLEDIGLQLGRTGKLTPVAHLRAVSVAGTTVARATLHNEDFIRQKDIRIGDTVILQKAGDIIPEVVEVVRELRPKDAEAWTFPEYSPLCAGDGKIERVPGEAAHRCKVGGSYGEQVLKLAHFVGKSALDIDGFGKKSIELLMQHELVSSYDDLFELTEDELSALPGMGEVSAKKLIDSIRNAKRVPFNRLLVGLSIPHVGEETALLLARKFRHLMRLSQQGTEDLMEVDGIGEIVAKSVASWFRDEGNKEMLERLTAHVKVEIVEDPAKGGILEGATVVVTGTLPTLSRDRAKALVIGAGGTVSGSVSGKTTFVLSGDKPGSKLDKARELGVPVIDENAFLKRLGK